MNSKNKKTIALAAADFLISNQLSLLRLTGKKKDNFTLSIPTVDGICEEDLKQILNNVFPTDSNTFEFKYISASEIKSSAANGTTIISITKKQ